MARNPDYLVRRINVEDRVRNLETGVHPTASDLNFFDTIDFTLLPVVGGAGWEYYSPGVSNFPVGYQKRVGTVAMSGQLEKLDTNVAFTEQTVFSLPVEIRPLTDLQFVVGLDNYSPFYTTVKVYKNGDVTIYKGTQVWTPDGVSAPVVHFEGPNWLTD